MSKVVYKYIIAFTLSIISFSASALPIDWHGVFGVDTTLIDNYRFVTSKTDASASGGGGSQEVALTGNDTDAAFQSYVFKLQPEMIINDAATLKAEFSSGYGRGGFLGDDSTRKANGNFGNALYAQNQSAGKSLVVNKVYAELYSDTATYVIGRHSAHWGLGALVNSGEGIWDRHSTTRDGITAKLKIGNFHINPFWTKVNNKGGLTGSSAVNDSGITLLYDNKEKDMQFGIYYGLKESGANATGVIANTDNNAANNTELGAVDIKMTDLFFSKRMGDLSIAFEVPIMSGTLGNVYENGTASGYKARAIIFESSYKISDSMTFGLDAGQVTGDDGAVSSFEAMYLNPNYQVAQLMFRYNMQAVSKDAQNIFDSYVTNTMYFKLKFGVKTDRVDWDFSLIKALAEKTAGASGDAFNHTTNTKFASTVAQSDDMGMELDIAFKYHWNKEVTIGGSAGYMLTGDYWAYTNDTNIVNEADNAFALQLNTSIQF